MEKAKAIEILNKLFDSYLIMEEMCLDTIIKVDGKQLTLRDRLDEITDTKIAMLTAIDALQQSSNIEAEHDNGWISVKDRLPDKDGKYMVWYKGESCICEFDAESQTFGDTYEDYDEIYSHLVCWDDDMHKDITHWMPLPEQPPESEDDAE